MVSADSDVGVLVVEWNIGDNWSPELIHTSTSVGVLVELSDDTLWNVDGGNLIVHVLWDQVVISKSGVLVIGEALLSSVLSEVLHDASSLIGGDNLEGAVPIVVSWWDITGESLIVVSEKTFVISVLVHRELDLLSDLDGRDDIVEAGKRDNLGVLVCTWGKTVFN